MAEILDVLVVGGGPVGACAAALLALDAPAARIAVLDPRRPTLPEHASPLDSRVLAISRASERIITAAGAWQRLPKSRLEPYERMRIWHEDSPPLSPAALVFDAAEAGEPNLGYILENRLLQAALLDSFTAAGGQFVTAELRTLQIGPEYVHVTTTAGEIAARLVVGADGAQSAVRHAVGINADKVDFQQTAIVATVATERPHEHTAWQRFMRDGTLALLPLADGNCSIVWSADNAVAGKLSAATGSEFATHLDRASDYALGKTRLVSEPSTFALLRLDAQHYSVQRCALIGDAAHVVHPLAGQGVNLGLLDAAALAQVVQQARSEREDPGATRVLRRYERWRRSETALMSSAISAFDRVLAHGSGPVSKLAQRGLGWVSRSQEIKRLFVDRALGLAGDLPRAAQ